jgi:mRNA interferase RelE/StbE
MPSVEKDLRNIPKEFVKKILNKVNMLGDNPRPFGCEKLADKERYRIRQGVYRIVYSIQDNELMVWVIKIGHRREIYR